MCPRQQELDLAAAAGQALPRDQSTALMFWRTPSRRQIEWDRIANGLVVAIKFSGVRLQFAIPPRAAKSPGSDDSAVRAYRRHVAGLVEEPDTLPFVEEQAQIFRRKDQLLRTPGWIGRVHRNEATSAGGQPPRSNQCRNDESHVEFSSLSVLDAMSARSCGAPPPCTTALGDAAGQCVSNCSRHVGLDEC